MAEGSQAIDSIGVALTLDTSQFDARIAAANTKAKAFESERTRVLRAPQSVDVTPRFAVTQAQVRGLRANINQHLDTIAARGESVAVPVKLGNSNWAGMRSQIAQKIGTVPIQVSISGSQPGLKRGGAGQTADLGQVISAWIATTQGLSLPNAQTQIIRAARSKGITGRRTGGPVVQDRDYLVGEDGPEVVRFDRPANVTPRRRGGKVESEYARALRDRRGLGSGYMQDMPDWYRDLYGQHRGVDTVGKPRLARDFVGRPFAQALPVDPPYRPNAMGGYVKPISYGPGFAHEARGGGVRGYGGKYGSVRPAQSSSYAEYQDRLWGSPVTDQGYAYHQTDNLRAIRRGGPRGSGVRPLGGSSWWTGGGTHLSRAHMSSSQMRLLRTPRSSFQRDASHFVVGDDMIPREDQAPRSIETTSRTVPRSDLQYWGEDDAWHRFRRGRARMGGGYSPAYRGKHVSAYGGKYGDTQVRHLNQHVYGDPEAQKIWDDVPNDPRYVYHGTHHLSQRRGQVMGGDTRRRPTATGALMIDTKGGQSAVNYGRGVAPVSNNWAGQYRDSVVNEGNTDAYMGEFRKWRGPAGTTPVSFWATNPKESAGYGSRLLRTRRTPDFSEPFGYAGPAGAADLELQNPEGYYNVTAKRKGLRDLEYYGYDDRFHKFRRGRARRFGGGVRHPGYGGKYGAARGQGKFENPAYPHSSFFPGTEWPEERTEKTGYLYHGAADIDSIRGVKKNQWYSGSGVGPTSENRHIMATGEGGSTWAQTSYWALNSLDSSDYGNALLRTRKTKDFQGPYSFDLDYPGVIARGGPEGKPYEMIAGERTIPRKQLQYFGSDDAWHKFRRGRRRGMGGWTPPTDVRSRFQHQELDEGDLPRVPEGMLRILRGGRRHQETDDNSLIQHRSRQGVYGPGVYAGLDTQEGRSIAFEYARTSSWRQGSDEMGQVQTGLVPKKSLAFMGGTTLPGMQAQYARWLRLKAASKNLSDWERQNWDLALQELLGGAGSTLGGSQFATQLSFFPGRETHESFEKSMARRGIHGALFDYTSTKPIRERGATTALVWDPRVIEPEVFDLKPFGSRRKAGGGYAHMMAGGWTGRVGDLLPAEREMLKRRGGAGAIQYTRNLRGKAAQLEPRHIAAGKGWYREAQDWIADTATAYGKDERIVRGMTAALSAGTAWDANKTKVLRILQADRDGKPYPYDIEGKLNAMPQGISNITGIMSREAQYKLGIRKRPLDAHVKAYKILHQGVDPESLLLKTPKTGRFYENMGGNLAAVTIDRWALRSATRGMLDKIARGPQRTKIERSFFKVAQEFGMQPAEFQAAIWLLEKEQTLHRAGREADIAKMGGNYTPVARDEAMPGRHGGGFMRGMKRAYAGAWAKMLRTTATQQGGTFNAVTGESPTKGYAVGIHEGDFRNPPTRDIRAMMTALRDAQRYGAPYVGTWMDEGRLVVDPVDVMSRKRDAMRTGRSTHQDAIYDIRRQQEIRLKKGKADGGWILKMMARKASGYPDAERLSPPVEPGMSNLWKQRQATSAVNPYQTWLNPDRFTWDHPAHPMHMDKATGRYKADDLRKSPMAVPERVHPDQRNAKGGHEKNDGTYLVGELNPELFVPDRLRYIIPPDVMDKLPKREAGGTVRKLGAGVMEVGTKGPHLFQPPEDGWIIPHTLTARVSSHIPRAATGARTGLPINLDDDERVTVDPVHPQAGRRQRAAAAKTSYAPSAEENESFLSNLNLATSLRRIGTIGTVQALSGRTPASALAGASSTFLGGRGDAIQNQARYQLALRDYTKWVSKNSVQLQEAANLQSAINSGSEKTLKLNEAQHTLLKDYAKKTEEVTSAEKSVTPSLGQIGKNFVSVLGAQLVYQAAMSAAGVAMEALTPAAQRLVDSQTGFTATTQRVSKAIGEGLRQTGGDLGAVLGGIGGQAGIGGAGLTFLQQKLGGGAFAKAGAAAEGEKSDLFKAAAGIGAPTGLIGGYGGLFGGSILAQQLGGGMGLAETVGKTAGELAGQARPGTQTIVPPGLDPNQVRAIQTNRGYGVSAEDRTKALTGIGVQTLTLPRNEQQQASFDALTSYATDMSDAMGRGAFAVGEAAFTFKNVGEKAAKDAHWADNLGDEAKQMQASGLELVDSTGKVVTDSKSYQKALSQLAQGDTIQSLASWTLQTQRGIKASFQATSAQTQQAIGTQIPAGLAFQLAQSPLLTGKQLAKVTGVNQPGVSNRGEIRSANRETLDLSQTLNDQAAAGKQAAIAQIQQYSLPDEAVANVAAFSKYFDQAAMYGKQIVALETRMAHINIAQQAREFAANMILAKRALADALGLAGRGGSRFGQLQRQDYFLGRESQSLSMNLQQRQINFQVATAGFSSNGQTAEEVQANVKQTKVEAGVAQQQLDIERERFSISLQLFNISNERAVADAKRSKELLQASFENQKQMQAIVQEIKVKEIAQAQAMQKAQAIFEGSNRNFSSVLSVSTERVAKFAGAVGSAITYMNQALRAATGQDTTTQGGTGTHRRHAAGITGFTTGETQMIVGEAGPEAVAVIRNPKVETMAMASPAGGGGAITMTLQINGPISVRDDSDINKIAAAVEERINRRVSLLGLRRPGG